MEKEIMATVLDCNGKEISFPTSKEYDLDSLKKVQNILLLMADKVHDVLEKNKIPYIITFGTLLGAVRHGGYIPWDDDFDIFLFEDDYDRAIQCLRKELPEWMIVHDRETDPIYWPYWSRLRDKNSTCYSEMWSDDNYYRYKGINLDLYKLKKAKRSEARLCIYHENIAHYKRKYEAGILTEEIYKKNIDDLKKKIQLEKERIRGTEGNEDEVWYFVVYGLDSVEKSTLFPLRKYTFEGREYWGPNNADALLRALYGDYMQIPAYEKRKTHYGCVSYENENFEYR